AQPRARIDLADRHAQPGPGRAHAALSAHGRRRPPGGVVAARPRPRTRPGRRCIAVKRALFTLLALALLCAPVLAQPAAAPPDDAPGDGGGSAQPPSGPIDSVDPLGGDIPKLAGRPVDRIQFRGNRKVEDDAIRVNLLTRVGAVLEPTKLREDLRAMWKMG